MGTSTVVSNKPNATSISNETIHTNSVFFVIFSVRFIFWPLFPDLFKIDIQHVSEVVRQESIQNEYINHHH